MKYGREHVWEKKNIPVGSIFSFSQKFFLTSLIPQGS